MTGLTNIENLVTRTEYGVLYSILGQSQETIRKHRYQVPSVHRPPQRVLYKASHL